MLAGSETGEQWTNVGTFPFPFAPDRSGTMDEGIAAIFSLKYAGKSNVWLSTNKNGGYKVMAASGFQPERISTHAVEEAIAGYSDIADAIGETYEDRGHTFYLLTFPSADVTWAYDFLTRQWHKRGTWIAEAHTFTYWRPVFHCFALDHHLMLDLEDGTLYHMSADHGVDVDDRPIRRVRRTPALVDEHRTVFFDWLEIVLQTGIGVVSGEPEDMDPRGMLRMSNDYGQTWGPERSESAGGVGEFRRHRFWNLGSGIARVYEYSVTARVPWRVSGAYQKVRQSGEAA
jgi:hypothetical protein